MSITENNHESDLACMDEALRLAAIAAEQGEVPVGAVVVRDGEIIARGYNRRETDKMATAHAEILAIEAACKALGGWRLPRCTLYVTMEPCPMCTGAIINSRIERVVFGCPDLVAGCCGTLVDLQSYHFNHTFEVQGGVREDESKQLLRTFFETRRRQQKEEKEKVDDLQRQLDDYKRKEETYNSKGLFYRLFNKF